MSAKPGLEAFDRKIEAIGLSREERQPHLQAMADLLMASGPRAPVYGCWRINPASRDYTDAWAELFVLANLATACGYRVTQTKGCGFGMPSLKRRTKGARIVNYVSFERLFRERVLEDGELATAKKPHKRRGHYRFLWKQSGIDRRLLPKTAHERLLVALKRKVRKIYVNPCWVGRGDWGDGDDHFEVNVGEE
jgi:hypothetical protein